MFLICLKSNWLKFLNINKILIYILKLTNPLFYIKNVPLDINKTIS